VRSALAQRWEAAEGDAAALAELAAGRLGWAVRALEHPELREERAERLERLMGLTGATRDERLRAAGELASDAEAARLTVRLWTQWWRDVTLAACGAGHLTSEGKARREAERQGRALGPKRCETFLRKLVGAQVALDQNANPRLTLDVLLLDLPTLGAVPTARQ
jgi:DNA polymerase-3 subunit delta'